MPRYADLRATLVDEIARGVYPVGSRFPTEFDLTARFGVSRQTVQEAMRRLVAEGILHRQTNVGTTVRAAAAPTAYTQTLMDLEELVHEAANTRLDVRSIALRTLTPSVAATLERPAGERWLQISGLRLVPGRPVPTCWVEIYVSEPYAEVRRWLRAEESTPVSTLLARRCGVEVAAVEQRVSATLMKPRVAALLGAKSQGPALTVRRTYHERADGLGCPAQIAITTYPGDRYAVATWLRRTNAK